MNIFNKFNVATEANNYSEESTDQVWIRNEQGELVLMEVKEDENDSEGE